MLNRIFVLSLTFNLVVVASFASTNEIAVIDASKKSALDKVWGLPVLYQNEKNPVIEEFDFTGRFQLDYFNVDSDKSKLPKQGQNDFLETRRFRLGIDSWFAQRHLELKATVDTALESYHAPSIFYNRMADLFLSARVNDALVLRAGKFEPHFGYDREFSDTMQKFFERSFFDDQVFNNTGNDYVTGASVSGKHANFGYQAAVFSDHVDKEFGQFDGGQSELFELNYDFAKALEADKALVAVDFMHMDNRTRANVFNTMQDAAAAYFDYQRGRFGLVTQVGYGHGIASKGDLYQFMAMPSWYFIKDKLEGIVRYQYGTATQPNGITTLNRQEKTIGKFTGDNYNSIYAGLNYYIYGQKLKVMAGEQYDELTGGTGKKAGYRGWTTMVGVRAFW